MKRPFVICEPFDLVAVSFPFVDGPGTKRRPALVISQQAFNAQGHTVLVMVTTRDHTPWPGDAEIVHFQEAGLSLPCRVRLKIFTLDNRLIVRKIGHLAPPDVESARTSLRSFLAG
jgi:mRNA interferase MazF